MIKKTKIVLLGILIGLVLSVLFYGASIERALLFHPTHRAGDNGLTPWVINGEYVGYSRVVRAPKNVWLMLYGNAGQAADRAYAIPSFSPKDSVYIMEYPGYGKRDGVPSKETFNKAAKEAFLYLKGAYPKLPVCVVGESIGSGPASSLAGLIPPSGKLTLIVPYEKLSLAAKDHVPAFIVWLLLKDNWDNLQALSGYTGPVEIFGAKDDAVIPVAHAKALAAAIPSAKFVLIDGGHNDWAYPGRVRISNP